MIRFYMKRCAVILAGLLLAAIPASCSSQSGFDPAPKRADDELPVPAETSVLSVPVELDAAILLQAVEAEVPQRLWSIDRRFERCVPKKKVKLLGRKMNVVPRIRCRVVGTVTRGPIRMHGDGRDIVFDVPIRARVTAKDVGGVLKEETATGSALAQARIRLDLAPDWTPRATVRLAYRWTSPPGIDFLGQRITFTDQADKELRPIIRRLENRLPGHLAKLQLRPKVERLWQAGFTSLRLNKSNPQAWMRLTPQRLMFDGYAIQRQTIRLKLGIEGQTETFVGAKPDAKRPVALPPPGRSGGNSGLHFFIPVIADYAEIEPKIEKALAKRASRPFDVPAIGDVTAGFANVTAYGTGNGRIAVGFDVTATPDSAPIGEVQGRVWLEANPVNRPGSAEIRFEKLAVTGNIDGPGGDLLLKLANGEEVLRAVENALGQDFAKDRDELVAKIADEIAENREGDFVIRASIADVETGQLQAFGKGLYLPVRATGDAVISYRLGR